jgi:DNA invertase Pin-like site-specific DNA recombinase
LAYIRAGDTLVVASLDRLARSTQHLCQIAVELERKQAHLRILDPHLEHATPPAMSFSGCYASSLSSSKNYGPDG